MSNRMSEGDVKALVNEDLKLIVMKDFTLTETGPARQKRAGYWCFNFVEFTSQQGKTLRLADFTSHENMIDLEAGARGDFYIAYKSPSLLIASVVNGKRRVSTIEPMPQMVKSPMDLFLCVALFPVPLTIMVIYWRVIANRRKRMRAHGFSEMEVDQFA